jgi:DnaJ family protein C protein 7
MLYGNRAAAYLMMENYSAALEDALTSIRLDEAYVKGYLRAGKCYINTGNFVKAKEILAQGFLRDKRNRALKAEELRLSRIEGLIKDVKDHIDNRKFRDALSLLGHPDFNGCEFPAFLVLQAKCMLGMKEYEKALAITAVIIRTDSSNVDAIEIRGRCLYFTGNSASAQQHFQQALRLDPDNAGCRDMLRQIKKVESLKKDANDLFANQEWSKAECLYTEAIGHNSPDPQMNKTLFSNRAAARSSQGSMRFMFHIRFVVNYFSRKVSRSSLRLFESLNLGSFVPSLFTSPR